jgi:hypothetical protein
MRDFPILRVPLIPADVRHGTMGFHLKPYVYQNKNTPYAQSLQTDGGAGDVEAGPAQLNFAPEEQRETHKVKS